MSTSPAAEAEQPTAGRTLPGPASGPLDDVILLAQDLRGLLHDQLQLVACEARLAVRSLCAMLAAAVIIGLLLVTAWLGVLGAAVLSLVSFGFAPASAMVVLAALNLLLALLAFGVVRRHSHRLGFQATLRSLKPVSAPGSPGSVA